MTVVLGPSFAGEITAAGLAGLPFAWNADGTITGRGNLTAQQNATLDAVIAAHDPTKPAVPASVTAAQARLALNAAGKRAAVEAVVAAATQDIKDYWQYSSNIDRQHPVILQMAAILGWTSTDLDTLFIAAAAIT
jgi:hypothetical protein